MYQNDKDDSLMYFHLSFPKLLLYFQESNVDITHRTKYCCTIIVNNKITHYLCNYCHNSFKMKKDVHHTESSKKMNSHV
jgi:hypothetical protein